MAAEISAGWQYFLGLLSIFFVWVFWAADFRKEGYLNL
jgi:hypothetical protein